MTKSAWLGIPWQDVQCNDYRGSGRGYETVNLVNDDISWTNTEHRIAVIEFRNNEARSNCMDDKLTRADLSTWMTRQWVYKNQMGHVPKSYYHIDTCVGICVDKVGPNNR
ncbi:hypothetical protein C8J55DRAFT_485356 [Lentinula edodes]|uniref:Uncharacterized protein n=1 Tax=Lentinula lateritia TaxID=40482 RepID=A0A9W9B1A9_9AGAR|nr:hypothetical protein C8J55DRAFT_485356 [Lentinula edodes]